MMKDAVEICRKHAKNGRYPYPVERFRDKDLPTNAPRSSLRYIMRRNVVFLTKKEAQDLET